MNDGLIEAHCDNFDRSQFFCCTVLLLDGTRDKQLLLDDATRYIKSSSVGE